MRALRVGLLRRVAAAALFIGVAATAGAGALVSGVVSASPAAADTAVTVGSGWQPFDFGAVGTHAEGGPFTFTSAVPVDLTVVDAFAAGDQFEVFDNGVSLGPTSAPSSGPDCDTPDACLADPSFSRGVFTLAPGTHSIDIVAKLSPFGAGGAYYRLDADAAAITPQVIASASPASPTYGQGVTFSAQLNPFPTGGSVSFVFNQSDGLGWVTACTVAVPAVVPPNNTVSCAYPAAADLGVGQPELKVGTFPVEAEYSGTTGFTPNANGINVTVAKGVTATALAVGPAQVGGPAALTATVSQQVPGTSAHPTGTVNFYVGYVSSAQPGTLVGTGTLSGTTATATLAMAVPGEQVTAVYAGDANFAGSVSSPPATVTAACTSAITGAHGSVTVTSGVTCLDNATITGSVTVAGSGSLVVTNSTVSGSVTDNSAGPMVVCGSTVGGSISAQNANGLVVVGDPAVGCAGNTVGQSITLVNNHHGLAAVGNTYHGSFTAAANTGAGPLPGDTAPVIGPNTKA